MYTTTKPNRNHNRNPKLRQYILNVFGAKRFVILANFCNRNKYSECNYSAIYSILKWNLLCTCF